MAPKPKPSGRTSKVRKRYGQARRPIVINLNDPKWADLRESLADDRPLSEKETDALLRDMGLKR
jgi:hypothetical protein